MILITEWSKWVVPLGVFGGCVAAGFVIRRILFRYVRRWAERTGHPVDQILIPSLRSPLMIWAMIVGLDLATRSSDIPRRYVTPVHTVLIALWILSLTIIAAQVAGRLVQSYSSHATGEVVSASLTRNVAQIVVSALGILILLNQMRVDIRPLLTALGVGGLAVALALQDTLANLFAGFYISVSQQTRIGDYVKLNSGEEGYVSDITWRSTTLRALGNNYIFIPNSKLAQSIVTNYNLPNKSMGQNILVRVGYDCDPDHVEALLLEVAKEAAADLKGLEASSAPSVTWNPGYGDSYLQLSLNYQVAEFVDQYSVGSELRKRVFKRLKGEGIALPYPSQTNYIKTLSNDGDQRG